MTLDEFIADNGAAIVSSWQDHAMTLLPGSKSMTALALQDHAREILDAIVVDMRTPQSRVQQHDKSLGGAERSSAARTAAELHAVLRAQSGFTINQLVAEYRALRASVLRKFADGCRVTPETLDEIGRFNESMDQAIAESVRCYAVETERWRNVFLGVLGHDLRGPLNSILLSANLLSRMSSEERMLNVTHSVVRGGRRMRELLDDLLDYSRTSLGTGIPVTPHEVDVAALCKDELEQLQSGLPDCLLQYEGPQSCVGLLDASRIRQVISNLVINASKYGDPLRPITVQLKTDSSGMALAVKNFGEPIPEATQASMFELTKRGDHGNDASSRTSLGLGLFIVREIVKGHGGDITCTRRDGETVFSATLPQPLRASSSHV